MATQGSKNSAAESEADKTKTLNTNSMEILVAAFSKAIKIEMTAGVAATSAAVTVAINAQYSRAKTTKYTSAINPYDNQSFRVDTKEVKYQWGQITNIRDGGTPISVTVVNVKTILDIFKDRANKYVLDHIINVPTTGTGRVAAQTWTLAGID